MRVRGLNNYLSLTLLAGLIAGLALPSTPAFAADEPNGAASCMGIERAAISPPGSSDEEPGGSHQFVGEVKGLAASQGVTAGSLFAWIASLHEGSHEDCDIALGGGEETGTATLARPSAVRLPQAGRSVGQSPVGSLAVAAINAWPKVD